MASIKVLSHCSRHESSPGPIIDDLNNEFVLPITKTQQLHPPKTLSGSWGGAYLLECTSKCSLYVWNLWLEVGCVSAGRN